MQKIFFLGLLISWAGMAFSQTITITDKATGKPLEMVTLLSQEPKAFTATNAKGKADLSAFRGSKKIEIRMLGYNMVVKSYNELKKSGFRVALAPATVNIDEIVIAATRRQQKSTGVPSKIATIAPREVTLQNPQTAADLLNLSGKVFVQKSQQGGGSPMIRGFATNRLLYTIDGIRMNTAIFRGGNIQNVISLDPFATAHTEVLFGPGSVIYGSDAIGGVMSFHTLEPQFALHDSAMTTGKALARYSSANNERTAHFDVNVGWKKWAVVSSISTNYYDDLRMGSHGPDDYLKPYYIERIDSTDVVVRNKDPRVQKPSGYSQKNIMQKIRFSPNQNWDFRYGFHYSETSDYGRFDRHLRLRDGQPRYAQWDYGPQKWMMNNLTISQLKSNPVYDELTLRMAHQFFEESRIDRDMNELWQRNRIEKIDAYFANLDFKKYAGTRHQLFYGLEWVLNDVNSTAFNRHINTGEKIPIGTRYPQSKWLSYAAYLTDHFQPTEQWDIQAGIRYNRFAIDAEFDTVFYDFPFEKASLDNDALTGSLGFTYRPNNQWVIKTNFSTGFRAPNIDDIGKVFDSEPGSVVVPNPNLKAEYAYNADIGIARLFGEWLKVDFTAYYTNLQNALVRRDYTLGNRDSIMYDGVMSRVQAIQNAAVANIYGIQATLEMNLPRGFGLTSDFNYQHGEEELDDGTVSSSRHAAPWFGISRLTYRNKKLRMQLYARYSGKVAYENLAVSEQGKPYLYASDGEGHHYSPAWYTLNYKAMYHVTPQITVTAGLENITDRRYRPYSSGIAAPGRNFIVSVKTTF